MLRQFVIQTSRRLNMIEGAGLSLRSRPAIPDHCSQWRYLPPVTCLFPASTCYWITFSWGISICRHPPAVDELEMYTKLGREPCRDCWARNIW